MDVFAALADPVRRALLEQLALTAVRVVDLAAGHEISRPAISRHLRVLDEAGLVSAEDRGRERHYRLTPAGLDPVHSWLDQVATGPTSPPGHRVPERALDGLDLEVRRTGRDHRQTTTPGTTETEETG